MRTFLASILALTLVACDDNPTEREKDKGVTPTDAAAESAATGKYEIYLTDDLLNVLEVRFLKGRCLGQLSINSQTGDGRAAVVSFAEALAQKIPLDGSQPATDEELKQLIPGDQEMDGWKEDTTDGISGPWLVTTDAFDWINGGGGPFQDNGFEAAAGETYGKDAPATDAGSEPWKLDVALVNQGTPAGAEAAFRAAGWDTGKAP
jgi:hypothetical protein